MSALARKAIAGGVLAAAAAGLFTASGAGTTPRWAGTWRAQPYGIQGSTLFELRQSGSHVSGAFPWQFVGDSFGQAPCFTGKGGTISGTARGRVLQATLVFPSGEGYPRSTARVRVELSRNGRRMEGRGDLLSGDCKGFAYIVDAVRVR